MTRALFKMIGQGTADPALSEAEWRKLLAFADRTQLTLYLRGTAGLPEWLAEEIEARYARNAERRRRLRDAYAEVAEVLHRAGIDFVLLKGFTHELGLDGSKRVQYDLDLLLFLATSVAPARRSNVSVTSLTGRSLCRKSTRGL